MKNKLQKFFYVIVFTCIALFATAQQATLMLNEINPSISSAHDLIELVAVSGGSVNGFTIEQGISSSVLLATLPAVNVSAGDIIVVHLIPATAAGAAPASETVSKSEYPNATFSANYDNAWDFHGGANGITNTNRVILVMDSAANIQDAVPFTNNGGAPGAFPGDVVNIQGQSLWYPADCGGSPCTYSSTPTVESISVNWQGSSTTPNGNTAQRQSNTDSNSNIDWTSSPQAQTWGALNVGQSISEKNNSFAGLTVFPNPASSELRIENGKLKIERIEIYNTLGKKVFQYQLSTINYQLSIDVSQLPSGIYFYRAILQENRIVSGKFTVE